MVDGRRVHFRAFDGFARGRREAVWQWQPQREAKECFCGDAATAMMMVAKSYYESAEQCPYLLIKPDPRCPECAAIMVWRFAHRGIVITSVEEIKLADYGWGSRHLHMRDARDAHHKIRVERERKERERKECFHPVA
jgi:hypothetical protein